MPKFYIERPNGQFTVEAQSADHAIYKLWLSRFRWAQEYIELADALGGFDYAAMQDMLREFDLRFEYNVSETGSDYKQVGAERAYAMIMALPDPTQSFIDTALIDQIGYDAWDQFTERMLEECYPLGNDEA